MFAPSPKSANATGREKVNRRKAKAITRSGSLLGTIKNTFASSLSWFVSKEDLGKRRRPDHPPRDHEEDETEETRQKVKRMRVDSPERVVQHTKPPTTGYLDPPSTTLRRIKFPVERTRAEQSGSKRHSVTYGALPSGLSRTMSIDPPSNYATLHRDPIHAQQLPSPAGSIQSQSTSLNTSTNRPSQLPFKLRTSLTPKPATEPLRREASAPPPISSLHARPIFVKPPPEEVKPPKLSERTLSLGTLADYTRSTRSPSRDRVLTGFGTLSSTPSYSSITSNVSLKPGLSRSEKLLHELDCYKTPIVPSRYKDLDSLPAFLKPKRVHVPIPMVKKGKSSKPSLGMAPKHREKKKQLRGRDDGKPYARTGGIGKLLALRRAEEMAEKEAQARLSDVEEEDDMEIDTKQKVSKRDIGVSAKMSTSGSESERSSPKITSQKDTDPNVTSNLEDPFLKSHQIGRSQPYGRIGRVRIREPGQRSVPLSKGRNKFSAMDDDDDDIAVDAGKKQDVSLNTDNMEQDKREEVRLPSFEAPKGFTFANTTTTIEHDHSNAKEPPIPSLPFALQKTADSQPMKTSFSGVPQPTLSIPTINVSNEGTSQTQTEQKATNIPSQPISRPDETPVLEPVKQTSNPSSFFATPPTNNVNPTLGGSGSTSSSSGIPNFFANSAFLNAEKSTAVPTSIDSSSSSSVDSNRASTASDHISPIRELKNQSWNKAATGESPASEPTRKPLFGVVPPENKTAPVGLATMENNIAYAPPIPPSSFAAHQKPQETPNAAKKPSAVPQFSPTPSVPTSASTMPNSSIHAAAASGSTSSPFSTSIPPGVTKPSESESKPIVPSFHNFGPGSMSNANAPKPLFGTGTLNSSPFLATNTQSNVEQKPAPFTFSAPPIANSSSSSSATGGDSVAAPKPLFGGTSSGTGFTFGASPPSSETPKNSTPFVFGSAPPTTTTTAAGQSAPTFSFGISRASNSPAPSSGFSFGTPTKSTETTSPQSPFTFGVTTPARPVTPPPKPDDGMRMEESPVRDVVPSESKPVGGITFGLGPTPSNPFSQNSSPSPFSFNTPSGVSNPFIAKEASSNSGFNFNRTASAPAISTSFSFGAKSDVSTPPTTAFGAAPNPFGASSTSTSAAPANPFGTPQSSNNSSSPFTFGQSQPASNPFGTQATASTTPSSPFTSAPAFTFGAPPSGSSNTPFAFSSSTPSSPATGTTALPQSPATSGSGFSFGQTSSSSGGTLFNIGAPPPSTTGGTPRQVRKLPRRGPPPKR